MRNTEISSILGKLWRDATDEERRPYVDRELCDRNKYKTVLATWKVEDALRKKEMLKRKVEMAEQQQQQQKQQQEQQQQEQQLQQQDIQRSYYQQHHPAILNPYHRSYYQQQQTGYPTTFQESPPSFVRTNYRIGTNKGQMHDTYSYPRHLHIPIPYCNPNKQHQGLTRIEQSNIFIAKNIMGKI